MKKQTKLSDILKHVKWLVRTSGRSYPYPFLCCILDGSYDYWLPGSEVQRWHLIRWIHKMLRGHGTLESWTAAKHPRFFIHNVQGVRLPKEARLAWLDWMIAECEKTGD